LSKKYLDFVSRKLDIGEHSGFAVKRPLNKMLFPFQKKIVKWALNMGKAAIFADCGLGKTPMQLEWASQIHKKTKKNILILAPLAVSNQTVKEGLKFGIKVNKARSMDGIQPGINITNYEMLNHFDPESFAGFIIDESSILKSFSGVYRKSLINFAKDIPYRLACTATPAPNDIVEIINHAEFLGIMSGKEILALYFRLDGNTTHKWVLKGHGQEHFWRWLASWSVAIRMPSDIGFKDDGFVLPPIEFKEHIVESKNNGTMLFPMEAQTLQERQQARKESIKDRSIMAAEIANINNHTYAVWCNLNSESHELNKLINKSVEVKGADSILHKEESLSGFADGKIRVLITKPTIAGFGINMQICHNVIFVGLSDSFEQFYQAVRRCWRFGQKEKVVVHIIISEREGAVLENIKRKEKQANEMMINIINHVNQYQLDGVCRETMEYRENIKCACGKCI